MKPATSQRDKGQQKEHTQSILFDPNKSNFCFKIKTWRKSSQWRHLVLKATPYQSYSTLSRHCNLRGAHFISRFVAQGTGLWLGKRGWAQVSGSLQPLSPSLPLSSSCIQLRANPMTQHQCFPVVPIHISHIVASILLPMKANCDCIYITPLLSALNTEPHRDFSFHRAASPLQIQADALHGRKKNILHPCLQ